MLVRLITLSTPFPPHVVVHIVVLPIPLRDIGGQAQYRSEWGRYTRGCDVIIYVVDAHAFDTIPLAKKELHRLLEDRELATTPLLVLANKVDLEPHISEPELIRELNLDYVTDNPWLVIPISALRVINIDQVRIVLLDPLPVLTTAPSP